MTWPPGSLPRALGCLALAALVYGSTPPPDAQRIGLALFVLFVLIGGLWMTQALDLSVTALLVSLLGVLAVLRLAAGRRDLAVALLFGLTALLSMWISNTATAAMMLPLALGLLREEDGARERAFVLLGVAYSASIGGMGTLVGSPPNAIAAAQAGIGFVQWMRFGVPLLTLLLPLMVGVLFLLLRPGLGGACLAPGERPPATPLSRSQRVTLVVFGFTAAGWIGAGPLGRALGTTADIDTAVALASIVALVASGTIGWPDLERRTQWGVLLLFGGGLALSEAMGASGASRYLAGMLTDALQGAPEVLLLLVMVAFAVFLTELVSNTATAALLVPVFLGVAVPLGLPAPLLAAAIAASASCAFMLPVATPPNAIVFATEQVPQVTMMRCGLVLNFVCIAVITAVATAVFR